MLKERYLKAQPKKKKPWYLDSGCSRNMIGDESLFQELDRNKSRNVSFGDNSKGVIRGIETIGNNFHTQIKNVLLVKNLNYNLLSINQLCEKGFKVCFELNACHVINSTINQIIYIGKRYENVYVIHIDEVVLNDESCLVANDVSDIHILMPRSEEHTSELQSLI